MTVVLTVICRPRAKRKPKALICLLSDTLVFGIRCDLDTVALQKYGSSFPTKQSGRMRRCAFGNQNQSRRSSWDKRCTGHLIDIVTELRASTCCQLGHGGDRTYLATTDDHLPVT